MGGVTAGRRKSLCPAEQPETGTRRILERARVGHQHSRDGAGEAIEARSEGAAARRPTAPHWDLTAPPWGTTK
ncbi:hypothetical protein NDU88_000972 [Pleurodeles waltl]|uniref:Uncharacterized protein n=1 Tax=Pleurodeles waltl TaxID=8319 RepID=A0AAV7N9P5_PLEWA|nr:hypothetical protein NDU88_000972 [Pleurodeles waltl]